MPGTRALGRRRQTAGDSELVIVLPSTPAACFLIWPGREAGEPLNSTVPGSHRSAGMSHAPRISWQEQRTGAGRSPFTRPLLLTAALLLNWCPRKDLNLQPLVCRTSAPSVELLGHDSGRSSGQGQEKRCAAPTSPVPDCCSCRLVFGRSWNRTNLSGFSDPR